MWRERILAELLIHDSVERGPDLQLQVDAARPSWIARRVLMATIAVAVLLGLLGVIASLLLWQIMLVVGLIVSEAEIRVVRAARTMREFDRRVAVFRAAFVASIGLILPIIAGPNWLIPVMLALAVATSAMQLRKLARKSVV